MIIANGVFALSEIAVLSSRRARLIRRMENGDSGAKTALDMVDSPSNFLTTVQVRITLIGTLAGAYGGATIAEDLAAIMRREDGSWLVDGAIPIQDLREVLQMDQFP